MTAHHCQLANAAGTMALVALVVCSWGALWIPGTMAQSGQTGTGSGGHLSSILTPGKFNDLFPQRLAFYTYESLTAAANHYPAFGATGSLVTQKQEVAAFLANVMQETGVLKYINEIGKPAGYCDPNSPGCPCANNQHYYGRGPIQISWNYNYCQAGKDLGLPTLLQDPGQVARNAVTAWRTAFWFWMTQPESGSSSHAKMIQNNGFGSTIKNINGMECGKAGNMYNRVNYYKHVCSVLNVNPGTKLTC